MQLNQGDLAKDESVDARDSCEDVSNKQDTEENKICNGAQGFLDSCILS